MGRAKENKSDYVAEEHGAIYNFFYTYKTHFFQLMTSNLMMVILSIPMLFLASVLVVNILPWVNPNLQIDSFVEYWSDASGNESLGNEAKDAAYQLYYLIVVFSVMFLVGVNLFAIGPFQAGFQQIYRNLHRQSGVFFFSDFKDGIKSNLKQSIALMIIGIVVTLTILFAIGFYFNALGGKLGMFLGAVFVVILLDFIIIQNMAYQIMVTVDLPVRKIYLNAILFTMLKLGPCTGLVGITVLMLGVIPFAMLLTTNYALMGLMLFSYAFLIFAFIQYMMAYATGEFIEEYIVSKLPPEEKETTSYFADDDDDSDEEDDDESEEEDELPEPSSVVITDEVESQDTEEDEFKIIEKENQLSDDV